MRLYVTFARILPVLWLSVDNRRGLTSLLHVVSYWQYWAVSARHAEAKTNWQVHCFDVLHWRCAFIRSALLVLGVTVLKSVSLSSDVNADIPTVKPTRCTNFTNYLFSGQSFWLQIQRSRVRFPALPDFLSSSRSGTGSTQPLEVNWGATWIKSSGSGPENRD